MTKFLYKKNSKKFQTFSLKKIVKLSQNLVCYQVKEIKYSCKFLWVSLVFKIFTNKLVSYNQYNQKEWKKKKNEWFS